jgi:aspartate/methionine/tyrosine aminotransferase
MKFQPFELERWLQEPCKYDIASAGITKLKLKDLTQSLDPEMVLNYGLTKGAEQICARVARLYRGAAADNVLITSGAAEANLLILLRLLEPGDEAVVVVPAYKQSIGIAEAMGVEVRRCFLIEEEGYRLDLGKLEACLSEKTRVICLVNPNNPTGTVIGEEQMRQVCAAAEKAGAWVLCDGALRGLELNGGPAPTPFEHYPRGIATGSLSKIGITGIRIGWLVAESGLVEKLWADKDYTTLCHSGIGEYLAGLALEPEKFEAFVDRAKGVMRNGLDVLADWISRNNRLVDWVPSSSGHTAFVRYKPAMGSEELAQKLLAEEEVLVSPGDYFDLPYHLRLRYSGERAELEEALERLGSFLARLC